MPRICDDGYDAQALNPTECYDANSGKSRSAFHMSIARDSLRSTPKFDCGGVADGEKIGRMTSGAGRNNP